MGICFGSQQRFVKQHPHMHATQPGPPEPSESHVAHHGGRAPDSEASKNGAIIHAKVK